MAEYEIPPLGGIPEDFFAAAGKITTGELPAILNKISNTTRGYHEPTITAALGEKSPGLAPTPVIVGTQVGLQFGAGEEAFRIFKIPGYYYANPAFHVHWTKGSNTPENGNSVRWRFSYTVWQGDASRIDAGASGYILTADDTYENAAADSTRYAYRTNDIPLSGFVPYHYVGVKLDVDFGSTTLVSNPILLSLDLTFDQYINKDV